MIYANIFEYFLLIVDFSLGNLKIFCFAIYRKSIQ